MNGPRPAYAEPADAGRRAGGSTFRRSLVSARAPVHEAAANDTAAEAPAVADDPVIVNSRVGIATG